MEDNISFVMPDNLVIKGTFLGNYQASDLIVMLHSGGYDRREKGVKAKNFQGKVYYNAVGNYELLSGMLKNEAAILLIDQRNHGHSGKNIDVQAMQHALKNIDNSLSDETIALINQFLKAKDTEALLTYINQLKLPDLVKEKILKLCQKPLVNDLSFLTMKDDLQEILNELKQKNDFKRVHLVGTCMGGLVASLYALENPSQVQSLTLFSPLFTFASTFLEPDNDFAKHKYDTIYSGKKFRMGNAVEGLKTYEEIYHISQYFYHDLFKTDFPVFCIQGVEDKLVPAKAQEKIFQEFKNYRETFGLEPVHFSLISPGVHCLYDTIFPASAEAYEFITSNLTHQKGRTLSK